MTLRNFLKLHQDGCIECLSIHQEPYDYKNHTYRKTFFEEVSQNDILESNKFKSISNMQVHHFNVIGGGYYKMELCIYLNES